jgi:hypothetical protein
MTTLTEWLNGANENPWQYEQVNLIAAALEKNKSQREALPKGHRERPGKLRDPGGVCFRLSFKWLACRIYGVPFKMDVTTANGARVITKQWKYLDRVTPYEKVSDTGKDDEVYYDFLNNVDRISIDLLNEWGHKARKEAKGGGVKYNLRFRSERKRSLAGATEFRADGAMVIGVYGTEAGKPPWAHATAFFRQGPTIFYFDSNGGEFTLAPGDDGGALIEKDMERYGIAPYQIRDYALYHAG